MKSKNYLVKFGAGLLCLFCLTLTAAAQKRRTPVRKTATKPAAAATTTVSAEANNLEVKSAADKVSIQVKNLTKFIFVLGGVAKDLEAIDADIKTGKITRQATIEQNRKNKQSVVTTIQNLRAGLVALEIDFRAKAPLRTYVMHVGGVSDLAAAAEDQAASGQFTQSGNTLISIVGKLSDALTAMP